MSEHLDVEQVRMTRRLLPVCTRPVGIHPYPTMWEDDAAAEHWIQRTLARHYGDESEPAPPCGRCGLEPSAHLGWDQGHLWIRRLSVQ